MLVNAFTSLISHKYRSFLAWSREIQLARRLEVVLTVSAMSSAIATYTTITSSTTSLGPDPYAVLGLVLLDLVLFLALAVLISRRIVRLWISRRRELGGSRFQGRIVLMFSLVSCLPTVIVAVFSTLFLHAGIQTWFDSRVSTALEASVVVAEAYLAEHKEVIRADILAMANDLNRQSFMLNEDLGLFNKVVSAQATLRSLTEAVVFQQNVILAKTDLSFSLSLERLNAEWLERADQGEVVVITSDNDDKVRALVKLENFFDTYLLVGRFVDNKVITHMDRTQGAVGEYKRLKSQISKLQIKFSIIFLIVALLLLFVAIWLGMIFAMALVKPMNHLVLAAEKIREGDLTARVQERPLNDEFGILARAFNRMTEQLERQRNELILANQQIDARRRLNDMVLAGVSAGVIALDQNRAVRLLNRSAMTLLGVNLESCQGESYIKILPELMELLAQAEKRPGVLIQEEVTVTRQEKSRILRVYVVMEQHSDTQHSDSYVITFDDVTDLLIAQRTNAWADVAQRVAHEIKNPLTPIHLAAERLKRKYTKEVTDQETFMKYADTITRHVKDIGRMVEEFVYFARLPAPTIIRADLVELVKQAVFSRQCTETCIEYILHAPETSVWIACDALQITQVLTNILKNSEESIEPQKNGIITVSMHIQNEEDRIKTDTTLEKCDGFCEVVIEDTGPGFPQGFLTRAMEPYVTTKTKGTGLGLAIVKKIMEDHHGTVTLANVSNGGANGGARVVLTFSL